MSAAPSPPPQTASTFPWRWVWAGLSVLVLAVALLMGFIGWAVGSHSGTRSLLSLVPGLQVVNPQGTLLGEFSADRVELGLGGRDSLVLQQLSWSPWEVDRDPKAAWRLHLATPRMSAQVLTLHLVEPSKRPKPMPASLSLPLSVDVDDAYVGRLELDAQPILTELHGRLALNTDEGQGHHFSRLQAQGAGMGLGGDLRIRTQRPFAVNAVLAVRRDASTGLPVSALLRADGPLAELPLRAEVQVGPRPPAPRGPLPFAGAPASVQTLAAQARWTPYAVLPLSRLQGEVEALDLQALWPQAPRTALTGKVQAALDGQGAGAPLQVDVDLKNETPLLWTEGGLPVRALVLRAHSDPAHPEQGRLESATAVLGGGREAGRLSAQGRWHVKPATATAPAALDAQWGTQWDGLDLQGLDARAPALTLQGPVVLDLKDLPLTGGTQAAPGSVTLNTQLNGQWREGTRLAAAAGQPFTLQLAAQAAVARPEALGPWELRELTLSQGTLKAAAGSADLKGKVLGPATAERNAGWRVQAEGNLREFDLRALGLGALSQSPGAQDLNASAKVDVVVPRERPQAVGAAAWSTWLAQVRGSADLNLKDSHLAGVPLKGQATLRSVAQGEWRAVAKLDAAGNAVDLDGSLDPTGPGRGDRWKLDLRAPALSALAPMLRMLMTEPPPVQGQLQAQTEVQGRWPDVSTRGTLQTQGLQWGGLASEKGQADWNLGTRSDAPLKLNADFTELRWGAERLHLLRASTSGTAATHRFELRLDRAARTPAAGSPTVADPPPWRQAMTAQLRGQGSLQTGDTLQWKAQIDTTALQTVDAEGVAKAPWLQIQPFAVTARHSAEESSVHVGATRVQLFSAELDLALLQWTQGAGREPRLDLQATLVPLAVAPMLARAQPGFGWGGDLMLGGQFVMRSTPSGVIADAEIVRQSGDLQITDDTSTQRLGLDQVRLALSARDGVWRATEILSGRNLGTLQGEQTARTDPRALGPDARSPLEGRMNLQIANLGALGAWLPIGTVGAGWRLSGELKSEARLGGLLGAPQYTGTLRGSRLGVRNGLEGVALTDGEIDVTLDGEQARVREFVVHAGEGTARLSGGAVFGAAPKATLKLVADRFALLQRVDRRLVLSGTGDVVLDAAATRVGGRLRIDEGLFDISRRDAPSLSDDVDVIATTPEPTAPAPSSNNGNGNGTKRRTLFDLAIDAGDQLRLRGRGIDTLLKGELRVATNATGRHLVTGIIRAQDGTYVAYGQKLVIDRGLIEFRGSIDNPRLDIEAIRPPAPGSDDSAVRVGVAISGTAQDPRVRLVSTPELSETNKLSYLVLGRSSDSLGGADLLVLQRAAVALLAGDGEDPSQGLFKRIGLDELSVSQGSGQTRDTIVKVGKQISARWYVGYERSLSATSGIWQVLYRIAQRFTVRMQSQQGEDASLDLIWSWRWD